MKKTISTCLLLIVANFAAQAQSSKAEEMNRQAYKSLVSCGYKYALRASKTTASATEISEAAASVCGAQYADAEATARVVASTRMVEAGVRSDEQLHIASEEASAKLATGFRRFIVSSVIEARSPPAEK